MRRESLVGCTVGGYLLEERIGTGGTAHVFRATHGLHGMVAVKVLRRRLRGDPIAVRRFLREARYGERVVHPNVVRTIERGEDGPLQFLALEWAPGELRGYEAQQRRDNVSRHHGIVELLTNASRVPSGDHDGTLIVP